MAKRIEMSSATKKGIALAIGALCVFAVGAVLVVGRDRGSAELQTASSFARGSGPDRQGRTDDGFPGPGQTDDGSFEQLRACLEEHGVTLPERGQQRGAQPDDDLRAAFEACRQYMPERPFGPGRGFGPPSGSGSPSQPQDGGSTSRGTF